MGIIKMKYVTLLLVLAVVRGTDAATYVVGDSLGWTIPTGGAATYATWAAKQTYAPGDILVFNYAAGVHDVATVTKASFDSCSSTNPLALQTVSPANVTLTTTGAHYFICTFNQHCSLGQKLTVNVTSTSAGPPASPPTAATPPPTATTPPPTAATPSTPPTAASPTTPPTAASPTTPPPAAAPVTPPAASPAPKGISPAPGPTAGGGTTPAPSPGPGGSAPVPGPVVGGGPTPPPSPTAANPPGSSTSPPPAGGSVSSPPPSSASRKAVATLAIGLVLAVMGVVC